VMGRTVLISCLVTRHEEEARVFAQAECDGMRYGMVWDV